MWKHNVGGKLLKPAQSDEPFSRDRHTPRAVECLVNEIHSRLFVSDQNQVLLPLCKCCGRRGIRVFFLRKDQPDDVVWILLVQLRLQGRRDHVVGRCHNSLEIDFRWIVADTFEGDKFRHEDEMMS